jgi:hypothetical protein
MQSALLGSLDSANRYAWTQEARGGGMITFRHTAFYQVCWHARKQFLESFWAPSQNCEKRLLSSTCLSVLPSTWNNSASTGRIFMKFEITVFFENLSRKFKLHSNVTRTVGVSNEDVAIVTIIYRSVLRTMGNISDKSCREIQNTHSMFSNVFRKIVPFVR